MLRKNRLEEDKKLRYIEIINSNAEHLLGLIEDIIDISKIESGKVELSQDHVYVEEFFNDLRERFQPLKPQIDIRYDCGNVVSFMGDRVKLGQILSNLIGNALKFTLSGFIEYSVTIKDNSLVFKVRDSGSGIKKKDREKIFDRFVQGDRSIWMSRSGTGLGLSIAKAYIDKMGGKIWLDSKWGKGSTFWYSIPFVPVKTGSTKISVYDHDINRYDRRIKILVVEDNMPGLLLIEEIFKDMEVEIVHAGNGKEAVELASRYDFDIVLMDIKMPVIGGIEATRRIKAIIPDLPVVAVSAHAFTDEQEKAIQAGCSDYITKPVQKDELLRVISRIIK